MDKILNIVDRLLDHLVNNTDVYVFFVGSMIIALQYMLQRRWLKSSLFFILCFIWLGPLYSFFIFIQGLGTDSFHEAQNFDLNEAIFWFKTLLSRTYYEISLKRLIVYALLALILFCSSTLLLYIFKVNFKKRSLLNKLLGSSLIFIALFSNLEGSIHLFYKNSKSFEQVKKNFNNSLPAIKANPKLNVLLYIGESTSTMNMGLYGYPRQTTPHLNQLEKKEGFIKFAKVFSTHTHTSPSLLEALSIDAETKEIIKPIHQRLRYSIVDILNSTNISTELYSNQGSSGTWNQASSIIFNKANKTFSTSNQTLGNNATEAKKPWDHDFFNKKLTHEKLNKSEPTLTVFHSYSGHGEYLLNIPEKFRKPIDDYFKSMTPSSVTGKVSSLRHIEDYDSAIRYIDFSVSNAINKVEKSSKPWVFIYFADHGESVFSGRGHDSSRFIHEMARIPFIMFFNLAAREAMPDLFKKYSKLAKTESTSTLGQLPSTILDLFNATVATDTLPIIGSPFLTPPILVRETSKGITAVNLNNEPLLDTLIDKTDNSTFHFAISEKYKQDIPLICYHRSNTLGKALRGSLVTNCLEIDVYVEDEGGAFAYHPPAMNTGLKLNKIFTSLNSHKNLSFWLDGKNLVSAKNCNNLLSILRKHNKNNSQMLVEFPSYSHQNKQEIQNCIESLNRFKTIHSSYYVPTSKIVACSKSLLSGKEFDTINACIDFKDDLIKVKRSELFSDLSFDYRGIKAIEALKLTFDYSWNTWNVKHSQFEMIKPERFRMVILINDDPNNM